MTLDEVAEELYGLDPSEFVATRTDRQKQARAEGDKALAKEIGALRKPTTVGWVLNVLARDAADEVGELLDLGEALREIQQHLRRTGSTGATLRSLTTQRQRAVRALASRAATIAADRGRPVGEDVLRDVAQSLGAALSDRGIADDVRRGRMVGSVEYSGFGPIGLVSVDDPEPETPQPETPEQDDTAEREAQEHRLRSEAELADAEAELARAAETARQTEGELDRARAAVDDLERELARARTTLDTADRAHVDAVGVRDAAAARVDTARRRLD